MEHQSNIKRAHLVPTLVLCELCQWLFLRSFRVMQQSQIIGGVYLEKLNSAAVYLRPEGCAVSNNKKTQTRRYIHECRNLTVMGRKSETMSLLKCVKKYNDNSQLL